MLSSVWQKLQAQQQALAPVALKALFEQNPDRFNQLSFEVGEILFDFSKQRITKAVIELFAEVAEKNQLSNYRKCLFEDNKLNCTENRAVLHPILRDLSEQSLLLQGENIKVAVQKTRQRLEAFANAIHSQQKVGATGKPFQDILCIGIGGSELGPALLVEALSSVQDPLLRCHFISNTDSKTLKKIQERLNPETTLCIVSSKTFTTPETLLNAKQIKQWYKQHLDAENYLEHMIAVTANKKLALNFGIGEENIFEFWDWVGGRYSVWSAVGLPIILAHGFAVFKSFLQGAQEMDAHFLSAEWSQNIPFLMAIIGIWNRNFWGSSAQAILPYEDALRLLPNYLQQLEMESNGKAVSKSTEKLNFPTAPIIFGGIGCNSQHAFMQLLHQADQIIPVDFLVPAKIPNELKEHHKLLFVSCLTQSKALMEGNEASVLYKNCPGNRPSTTMLYTQLTPKVLGALIAAYEHKVFVQGILWDINSFDQWGVELGKKLAQNILPLLEEDLDAHDLDASTKGLIHFFQRQNQKTV